MNKRQLTRLEIIGLRKGYIRLTIIYVYKIIISSEKTYRDEVFVVSSVKKKNNPKGIKLG